MSRRGWINLAAVIGVLAVVVGAAWWNEHHPTETVPSEAETGAERAAEPGPTGLPRVVDLGSDQCIPCRRMAPFLRELEQEYAGRFEIIFLDVRRDPESGRRYDIRVIPTQVFFDGAGREVWRHEGFISKQAIVDKLIELEG